MTALRWFARHVDQPERRVRVLTPGLLIGLAVGVPVTVAVGAVMALSRSLFNSTNAALVLMIVVVVIAVAGGRTAGVVTAVAAVLSFDFFHTRPYLSLAIDSRDDIETTVLLLIAGLIAGTVATSAQAARRRASVARSEIQGVHRIAEAVASGRPTDEVIQLAQVELAALLQLQSARFEALDQAELLPLPRLGRSGAIELQSEMRYARARDGGGGFELPEGGVELPVFARGQRIGRFVLVPTPGRGTKLDERMMAVAIADQVGAAFQPTT